MLNQFGPYILLGNHISANDVEQRFTIVGIDDRMSVCQDHPCEKCYVRLVVRTI